MSVDKDKLFSNLASEGEKAVREKLAQGIYGSQKEQLVYEWLRQQDEVRNNEELKKERDINLQFLSAARSSKNAAWMAAIIAFLSFVASIYVFVSSTQKKDENVLFRVGSRHGNYKTEVIEGPNKDYPAMIPKLWKGHLVNHETYTVTLMKYKLVQISDEFPKANHNLGLSEDEENFLRMPISLKPGEPRTIFLQAGILVDKHVYRILKEKYPIGSKTSNGRIKSFLADHRIDVTGRPIEYTKYPNGGTSYRRLPPSEKDKQQIFLSTFKTSRGNNISAMFTEFRQF